MRSGADLANPAPQYSRQPPAAMELIGSTDPIVVSPKFPNMISTSY